MDLNRVTSKALQIRIAPSKHSAKFLLTINVAVVDSCYKTPRRANARRRVKNSQPPAEFVSVSKRGSLHIVSAICELLTRATSSGKLTNGKQSNRNISNFSGLLRNSRHSSETVSESRSARRQMVMGPLPVWKIRRW
jgi:hypothetical protein